MNSFIDNFYNVNFNDERINYALNTLYLSRQGRGILNQIFSNFPFKIIDAVDAGEEIKVSKFGKTYENKFYFDDHTYSLNNVSFIVRDDEQSKNLTISMDSYQEKNNGGLLFNYFSEKFLENKKQTVEDINIKVDIVGPFCVFSFMKKGMVPHMVIKKSEPILTEKKKLLTKESYNNLDFCMLKSFYQKQYKKIRENQQSLQDFLNKEEQTFGH